MNDLSTLHDKASDMVTCATCQHIKRHQNASKSMYAVKNGFCGCALQPAYVYMTRFFKRLCTDFVVKVAA